MLEEFIHGASYTFVMSIEAAADKYFLAGLIWLPQEKYYYILHLLDKLI